MTEEEIKLTSLIQFRENSQYFNTEISKCLEQFRNNAILHIDEISHQIKNMFEIHGIMKNAHTLSRRMNSMAERINKDSNINEFQKMELFQEEASPLIEIFDNFKNVNIEVSEILNTFIKRINLDKEFIYLDSILKKLSEDFKVLEKKYVDKSKSMEDQIPDEENQIPGRQSVQPKFGDSLFVNKGTTFFFQPHVSVFLARSNSQLEESREECKCTDKDINRLCESFAKHDIVYRQEDAGLNLILKGCTKCELRNPDSKFQITNQETLSILVQSEKDNLNKLPDNKKNKLAHIKKLQILFKAKCIFCQGLQNSWNKILLNCNCIACRKCFVMHLRDRTNHYNQSIAKKRTQNLEVLIWDSYKCICDTPIPTRFVAQTLKEEFQFHLHSRRLAYSKTQNYNFLLLVFTFFKNVKCNYICISCGKDKKPLKLCLWEPCEHIICKKCLLM